MREASFVAPFTLALIALGCGSNRDHGSGGGVPGSGGGSAVGGASPGGAGALGGGSGGQGPIGGTFPTGGSPPVGGVGGGTRTAGASGTGAFGAGGTAGASAGFGGSPGGGGGASAGAAGDGTSGTAAAPSGAAGAAGARGAATGGSGAEGGFAGAAGSGGVSCAGAPAILTCIDRVEPGAGTWTSWGEQAPVTSQEWISDAPHGQAVRFTTDAAFAYHVAVELPSPIDVSALDELYLLVRCHNPSPTGWQMNVPRVSLLDVSGGRLVLDPAKPLVPRDGVTWVALHVPLTGGSGWTLSGGADLSAVRGVELELDTWDSGFVLDLDGLSFIPAGGVCAAECPEACSDHGRCRETGVCECQLGYGGATCAACEDGFVAAGASCVLGSDGAYDEWPNPVSRSNSDAWLVLHHDEVQRLRPNLLVLNFANPSTPQGVTSLVDGIVTALREASRFHGYEDDAAPAQLEYERLPIRDLRDGVDGRPPPPADYPYENSTLFPRDDSGGELRLDYARFFSQDFAPHLGFADASEPNGFADLCKLVDAGLVHELWMVGSGDVPDAAAAEVLEAKPVYGATGNPTGSRELCAGNGCFAPEVPVCARSLRIGFVNYNRGVGCFLESESHGIESLGQRHIVPGLSEWFVPFASFDLDVRYGLPYSSLYACAYNDFQCVTHPTPDSAVVTVDGQSHALSAFDPRCGNVHFAPTARGHYDLDNTQTVLSSCRDFGAAPLCGADPQRTVGNADFERYADLAPDCQGRFLVWWLQNMPGFGSDRHFPDGTPMKAFWPFLFY